MPKESVLSHGQRVALREYNNAGIQMASLLRHKTENEVNLCGVSDAIHRYKSAEDVA